MIGTGLDITNISLFQGHGPATPYVPPVTAGPDLTGVAADGWQATWPDPPATPQGHILSLTRQGHDASGAAGPVAEDIPVTARVRQPGSATPTADRVALADYVYQGDTLPAGIANGSALDYPIAQFAWLIPDRQEVRGDTIDLRIAVAHRHARNGRPVAAVRFIVTDHEGTEADALVTACTPHTFSASGLTASVYEATVDISTLANGRQPEAATPWKQDYLTLDAEFRPWVGTAHKITEIVTTTVKAINNKILYFNNRGDWRPKRYAYVSTTGDNATGVLSADPAIAAANPYATTKAAATDLQAFYTGAVNRNTVDGAVIRLEEGVHAHATWPTVRSDSFVLTMEAAPGANPANVVYTDAGASTRNGIATKIIFRNLTLRRTTSAVIEFLDAAHDPGQSFLGLVNVHLDDDGHGTAGNWIWRWDQIYAENCTQTAALVLPSKVVGSHGNFTGSPTQACIATRVPNGQIFKDSARNPSGMFIGWSHISNDRSQFQHTVLVARSCDTRGFAIVGNILEAYDTGPGATVVIYGDGNTQDSTNLNIFANTQLGQRSNITYTDAGGTTRHNHLAVLRFNIFYELNHKAGDFFGYIPTGETPNDARVGNWAIRYGVSAQANTILQGQSQPAANPYYPMSWLGDVKPNASTAGTQNTPLNITFANDQSGSAGSGGGNYTPTTQNNHIAKIPQNQSPYPTDLKNNTIPQNGNAIAGAVQS